MIHWPEIIQESFWPFVIQLVVDIHNSTPNYSGLFPLEIFSGIKASNTRHHLTFTLSESQNIKVETQI
jgi:hypothetical protein